MEKAIFIDLNIALTVISHVMIIINMFHLAVETKIEIALLAAEEVFSDLFSGTVAASIEINTIINAECHVFQLMVIFTQFLRLSTTVS